MGNSLLQAVPREQIAHWDAALHCHRIGVLALAYLASCCILLNCAVVSLYTIGQSLPGLKSLLLLHLTSSGCSAAPHTWEAARASRVDNQLACNKIFMYSNRASARP